jgi:hypothetical protein
MIILGYSVTKVVHFHLMAYYHSILLLLLLETPLYMNLKMNGSSKFDHTITIIMNVDEERKVAKVRAQTTGSISLQVQLLYNNATRCRGYSNSRDHFIVRCTTVGCCLNMCLVYDCFTHQRWVESNDYLFIFVKVSRHRNHVIEITSSCFIMLHHAFKERTTVCIIINMILK